MNFKSLLLGSAAAMAASSVAQAADAIVVEPEPVEYVRVCDMYGTGYFYIPGTETCLKLGGYVQAEYASSHYHDQPQNIFVNSDREVVFQDTDTLGNHFFRSRALLNVTAKNETAYGTLHSEIRWYSQVLDGNPDFDTFSTSDSRRDNGVGVWLATMSLAGFRVGYDATNYTIWNTYGGYGFYNAAQSGGYTEASGFLFEYNGSFGNLDYGIGIVDTAQSGAAGQPDIMAGLLTNLGDLALGGAVVYDSNSQGFAYRVRADYDLSSFIPGFRFGGWWSADNGETDYRKGHQWGVTARMRVLDNVTVFAGYSEYDYSCDLDNDDSPGDPANHGGAWGNAYPNAVTGGQCSAYAGGFGGRYEADYGSDQWTAGARWDVTPNLFVQLEYNKLQETTFTPVTPRRRENSVITETDRGTTWLRIRRSF